MYYAIAEGKKLPTERLRWLKQQSNGVFVHCDDDEGQGVIIDEEIYHVGGRPEIDKPTVDIIWEDDTKKLMEAVGLGAGTDKDPGAALASAVRFSKILFKQSLPDLTAAEILACDALLDEWAPDAYTADDVRNHSGQVWRCCQAHDSANDSKNIIPGEDSGAEFWVPYHSTEAKSARPWVKPTGTHNKYRKGEYMAYKDGVKYRCKADTENSPEETAKAWEAVK